MTQARVNRHFTDEDKSTGRMVSDPFVRLEFIGDHPLSLDREQIPWQTFQNFGMGNSQNGQPFVNWDVDNEILNFNNEVTQTYDCEFDFYFESQNRPNDIFINFHIPKPDSPIRFPLPGTAERMSLVELDRRERQEAFYSKNIYSLANGDIVNHGIKTELHYESDGILNLSQAPKLLHAVLLIYAR